MSIDKRIESVLRRFDEQLITDHDGEQGGQVAFDDLVEYLNYCPQYIEVLEKLLPLLNKTCPGGTKRAINLMTTKPEDACFIGYEDFSVDECLVIQLTLPQREEVEDFDPAITAIEDLIENFANTQEDFNGVIAVEIR